MRVTTEIQTALLKKKQDDKLTNVEMGQALRTTPQTIGRWIAGQVKTMDDDTGERLLRFLGIEEIPSGVTSDVNRQVIRIAYHGKAMSPILEDGQELFAEPCIPSELQEWDLVACRFKKGHTPITVVRHWRQTIHAVTLEPENDKGEAFETSLAKIDWIAKLLIPTRTVTVRE